MRKEWLARIIVIILVAGGVVLILLGGWANAKGVNLHARMAETGGWTPEALTAEVGKPLHLRLTSDDVMHGFAIGQSDQPPVDVIPGEISEVSLVFDRPGKYTFYCTRWCGANHWRMRGTIDVIGEKGETLAVNPPLYLTLGLDIDADHEAGAIPEQVPSAQRGAQLGITIPDNYLKREYYQAHTPFDLWKALGEKPGLKQLTDQERWDLVAWVWQTNTSRQELQEGKELYAANCAACHGEDGSGDGVFADELDKPKVGEHSGMQTGEMTTRPANFTDPVTMLSASPAHLQGKILRGGMGTGMPYWGPIVKDEQTWALIAFLYSFQFDVEEEP
jgi:mono/diheme cytochrome c family protein/plastocyanin